MTSHNDQIRALIAEIDATLEKPSGFLGRLSGEGAKNRDTLEHLRNYLLSLQGNMRKARRRAKKMGFDPNTWFGNVEIGMYRAVSGEPASYVRNIYKYYVTYQGLERSRQAREQALESQSN